MAELSFLAKFEKELDNMDGVGTSALPPRYWYSTGNYVLNRIISGSFRKGIPQGRITDLAGASGSGKSFLAANLVKAAQQAGAFCLVIDSENALDDEFMGKIGVNTNEGYKYVGVTTINGVTKIVSKFLKGYKEDRGTEEDAPQVLILIDSLDMLMTETEVEHYDKGDQKGDQGQRNKQLKAMLRTFVQDIKNLNVAMVVTSQVYKNQDLKSGDGVWIVSDAVKYACSQIILLSKLKLKNTKDTKVVDGIRMRAEGYKTRFCKPFSVVTVEVPYETGMDPYSGLIETAVELGVVVKKGSRYSLAGSDDTWYASAMEPFCPSILEECERLGTDKRLVGLLDDDIDTDDVESKEETSARRKKKVSK